MNNFVIYAPGYDKNIGGICALHFLAHHLVVLGAKNVYLTAPNKNPRWDGTLLDAHLRGCRSSSWFFKLYKIFLVLRKIAFLKTFYRKINRRIVALYPKFIWNFLNRERTVVIYAENIKGNPLKAQHVVRWVLNDPDENQGFGIYEPTDHVFKYHDFYKVGSQYVVRGILTAIDLRYHLDVYQNRNNPSRSGGAFLIKKGHHKNLNQHPKSFSCIDSLFLKLSDEEKADYFNQIKTFISYDHMTFLSVQAALCGCESIIIPDDVGAYSAEQLKSKNPLWGIAYGYDDLQHAISTAHLLRPHFEKLDEAQLQTIADFKLYCEINIFKGEL